MSKWERIATTALTAVAVWGVLFAVVLLTTSITGEPAGTIGLVFPIGLASLYFLAESWRIRQDDKENASKPRPEQAHSRS